MEVKQIYKLPRNDMCYLGLTNDNIALLHQQNHSLHSILLCYKECISFYHKKRLWDKYKKFANKYELVTSNYLHLPILTAHQTISRSYYKLWEIVHDVLPLFISRQESMKCTFLADGPGGFIEAFINMRAAKGCPLGYDELFGVTLLSSNKSVPNWKFSKDYVRENNITLLAGADGTGDLYKMDNINNIISTVGEHSCDLVTADGGFDFSNDYNMQEEISSRLIFSEIFTILKLQKNGGACVIKIFDICNTDTLFLLHVLWTSYEDVFITKPFSSRPANSEKYIVCSGFHKSDGFDSYLGTIHEYVMTGKAPSLLTYSDALLPSVIDINSYFVARQIQNISSSIKLIEDINSSNHKYDSFEMFVKPIIYTQLEAAIRWLHNYKIKTNLVALKKYVDYLKLQ